jgi:glycosyltransferase involved in cell wall biosynthesis
MHSETKERNTKGNSRLQINIPSGLKSSGVMYPNPIMPALSAAYGEKFDVILVTSPPLFVGITAYLLSKLKGLPFVFEVRDLWPESAIDTGVLKNKFVIRLAYWFESFIYKKARLINVLTPAFRDKLIQEKGVPSQKVIFIPNAADFSLSDELLENFDREGFRKTHQIDDKVVITYVGAHGVANHLIQVIDTAEILRNEPSVLFQMIGDGMQKPELKKEAVKRGLTNIRFVDPVPKKEVFKYITFDYMACKRPVLMVIDGVSRQLVEDAECGAYVEPEEPDAFAAKIKEYLAAGRKTWAIQGESGYRFAKKYFDRHYLAKSYLEQLAKVL